MNELVIQETSTGLAISDDTKASIVSSVSGDVIKVAHPPASLVTKLIEVGI